MSVDRNDIRARVRSALTEQGEDEQRELGVTQDVAAGYQPDQYAQSRKLGEEFGVPAKTVADNPEPYRKQSVKQAVQAALADAPSTQSWMRDLDNAAVAQDDVESLAKLERSMSSVSGATRVADVARSVPGGFYKSFGMSVSGVGRLYGAGQRAFSSAVEAGLRGIGADQAADFLATPRESLASLDPGKGLLALGTSIEADADVIGAPAERQNLATDIAGGLGQIAGQIAVALTGGTIPSTLSLLGQGADIQGDRAEAAGASQEDTDRAVMVGSLVTAITERYQLDNLLNHAPPALKNAVLARLASVAMAGGSEALQEVVEGIGQNLTAKAIYEPDAAIFEGLERDALAAGGAGGLAKAIIDAMVPGRARSQGRRDGDAAADISAILGESKLASRSPEALEQLAAAIRERTGAEFAYVDPAAFRTLYQSDEEANAAADELTGGQNAYFESAVAGTPIAIPIEKYVARVAPKVGELEVDEQPFTDFVSFDPEGMNGAEAEGSRETLEAQAREIADREMGEVRPDASEAVYDDVLGQLIAGGMERSTAEKNAKLTQSVFRSLGSRAGVDPKALYDRYNLRVRRELPDVLASVPDVDLELDPLLDRLRAGDVPSQSDAFGPSLIEFIRTLGGLKDEGGELAGRDIDKANKPFQRNVLQPDGRSLDDVAELLVESGYMTERDPNALLDLIDQELRGDPVFAFGNQKQDVIATREYLMQLEEQLGRRGIDLKQTSNLEARRILSQQRFDQAAREQTQTEAFKRWFGDSKVVDENGKPLRVYHGTGKDFGPQFMTEPRNANVDIDGIGAWFAAEPRLSNAVIDHYAERKEAPVTVPAYLAIRNPLVVQSRRWLSSVMLTRGAENGTEQANAALQAQLRDDPVQAVKDIKVRLIASGYDGIHILDDHNHGAAWIAFHPTQIKSATGNRGTFDPDSDNVLFQGGQPAPTFFSALTRAAESAKLNKATAQQWIATLKNTAGVKPEELQWSGVEEWLKALERPATKQEVVEYLKANEIQVVDVMKGAMNAEATDQLLGHIEESMGILGRNFGGEVLTEQQKEDFADFDHYLERAYNLVSLGKIDLADAEIAKARNLERAYDPDTTVTDELLYEVKQGGRTTYGEYQLPGGENYRELLLTLPEMTIADKVTYEERTRYETLIDTLQERMLTTEEFAEAQAIKDRLKRELEFDNRNTPYESSHWKEKNVLAHVRFNERTDADGKRVLLVEEIQSDWHQEGRRKGYHPKDAAEQLQQLNAEANRLTGSTEGDRQSRLERLADIENEEHELRRSAAEGVPDAPFKTTWPELAFKRMVRYAAENGFERIAWTPGKQQAERYDLSKQISEVLHEKAGEGLYEVIAFNHEGDKVFNEDEITLERVEEVLGKEIAKKIEAGEGQEQKGGYREWKSLSGLDLRVGGGGMLAFYDQILPATVNKLVKKWGAKVGRSTIDKTVPGREFTKTDGTRAIYQPSTETLEVQSVDVTPAMREAALGGLPLFQRGANDAKRGSITFGADRQFTVSLFEKADLSTFLHESGHFYLEIMGDLAEDANAPQQIKQDYQTLLKWLGVKGRAGIATDQHEQFARGFEAYLFEGKAPSQDLATVFDRFRAWLIGVYRTIARLNVTLNDEVRGVMDRIVATDEEIRTAEAGQNYAPVFLNAEAAGMSQTEFAAYRDIVDRAHRESVNELTGRAMAELARERKAWWKEEHAKVLVEVATEVDALPAYQALAILSSGKLPDGSDLPAKLSKSDLIARYGKEFAKRLPRKTVDKTGGISADVMAQLLGFESGDALVKAIVGARPRKELVKAEADARMRERYGDMLTDGTLVEEALSAVHTEARAKVLAAELRALKRKRKEVRPFVDAAEDSRQQQAREARDANYGNLLSKQEIAALREQAGLQVALNPDTEPDGYAKLADRAGKKAFDFASEGKFEDAAHHKRIEILNRELYYASLEAQEKAQREAARKKLSEQRAARDANAATLPDREELQALKLAAQRAISMKKIRAIQPQLYRRAEAQSARAAFEAATKGDFEQAYSEKRRQIYNYELFRAAVDARANVDSNVDYMRRFEKKSVREKLAAAKGQYLQQIDALRSRYDFTPKPLNEDLRRDKLTKWVDEQIAAGREVTIPQWVIDEARTIPYKELLAIELDGLVDAAKNIEHLARTKDRLLRNKKEADFKQAKAELETRARASLKGGKAPPVSQFEEDFFKRSRRFVTNLFDTIQRAETLIEHLDDGKAGPWHDFIMEPANNAEYARESLRTKILEPMLKLANGINRARRAELHQDVPIASLRTSFDRRTLISIALNLGNESNRERLLEGGFRDVRRGNRIAKFTPESLEEIKGKLTAADWAFIQEAWNTAESLWPEMKAFQERMGGLVPEKIPATPIETAFGTFSGGYWPAVYDPLASKAGAKQADATDALGVLMGGHFSRASTSKSALKGRTGTGGALLLDFSQIMGRHLDQVITDITHREFAIQATRILDDPDLSATLQDTIGEVGWRSLQGMVAGTIGQDAGFGDLATKDIETWQRRMISNLAVSALGFKLVTAFGNVVMAPFQAAARVKPTYILKGFARHMAQRKDARAFVDASSEMMRNRAQNMDAAFNVIREKLIAQNSHLAETQRAAMAIHQAADYLVTTGIWIGAYQQELDTGSPHTEAVRIADKAIRMTQTAGAPKDLSAFERNPGYRAFKLFLGPMIIMNNRMREAVQRKGVVKTWPESFGVLLATYFLPAIIWDLVTGRGPDDDDDDDDVLTDEALPWALRKLLVYPFMTVPYLRDVAGLAERKLANSSAEARMNPAADAMWLVYKLGETVARQASEADADDEDDAGKITRAGLQAAAPLFGVPTAPFEIPATYMYDVWRGEYEPEGAGDLRYLLIRRPKED